MWELVIVAATIVAALVIPAQLALSPPPADSFIFEMVLSGLYAIDTAFYLNRKTSSMRVLKPHRFALLWIAIDIISSIPFGLMALPAATRLIHLVKCFRLAYYISELWRRNVHESVVLRITIFAFWLGLAIHWLACGWLGLRGMTENADAATNYIESVYFCVTTLTTVGFGDVLAVSNAERVYVIGMMLFGVGVYGFAIGNVASMLARIDPARAHYRENIERLNAFMKYKSIPANLRKRLTAYYAYLWEQRLGYDESQILGSLPPSLKVDVSLHLKRNIIQKVPLFVDASESFIREIALQIVPVVATPGDLVVRAGEVGNEMYFVSKGELEVVSKDGETVLAHLSDGDFFGEIALILNQRRSAGVRACTFCDLYRLDRELFERVLSLYPDVAAKIHERAIERSMRE